MAAECADGAACASPTLAGVGPEQCLDRNRFCNFEIRLITDNIVKYE